ncbi:DNRLRE domain-containing protein [Thalassotalea fonticola]|uniref:DNRLRE domain-containing protein n=1 Tax=Thalassotalea fonticola TaxID=3065649 RepID=A0ABZ0GJS4_9GAMM|nr:DNRLRE domain-containing protein [Colwelliaceae bacterium S1-1]
MHKTLGNTLKTTAKYGLLLTTLLSGFVNAKVIGNATTVTTVELDKDTYIQKNDVGTNFGNKWFMHVAKISGGGAKVSFIQFTLGDELTSGAKVELVLTARKVVNETLVQLRPATNTSWDETKLTWDNRWDATDGVNYGDVLETFTVAAQDIPADGETGNSYSIDITAHIDGPGSYSFALTNEDQWTDTSFFTRHQSNSDKRPKVLITKDKSYGFSLSPSYFLVNPDPQASSQQTVTLSNEGEVPLQYKGMAANDDISHDQFSYTDNTCSTSEALAQGQSCSFKVVKSYDPTRDAVSEHDLVMLKYSYLDAQGNEGAPMKYPIYIRDSSAEPTAAQAKRRVAPQAKSFRLTDTTTDNEITNLPVSGSDYDIKFTVDGYHNSYRTLVALFDCVDTTADSCAASFNDNIGYVEATAGTPGTGATSYQGNNSATTDFTGSITMPSYANTLVARAYYRSDFDESAANRFTSLVASGGQGMTFADGLGRKIIIQTAQ